MYKLLNKIKSFKTMHVAITNENYHLFLRKGQKPRWVKKTITRNIRFCRPKCFCGTKLNLWTIHTKVEVTNFKLVLLLKGHKRCRVQYVTPFLNHSCLTMYTARDRVSLAKLLTKCTVRPI